MSAMSLRRIGIVANFTKPSAGDRVRVAAELIQRSGRQVLTDAQTGRLAGIRSRSFRSIAALAKAAELVLVVGGDGTMLQVARELKGSQTPLLGINVGGLGFLTAVSAADLEEALEKVWRGAYRFESRALIEASGRSRGKAFRSVALNEFVISRRNISRLIELETSVDGQFLTRYRGGGLIVSSPTGSTAYSLAAGGAVVYPTAEVFLLTPICPHALLNRSLVVNLNSNIEVTIISIQPESTLSADGQLERELSAGDRLIIRRSRNSVCLAHLEGSSFFETLRHKLNWSGSNL